jgi:murein DD-endopeptidase MepM/ murein hydrolase activator NlpD
MSLLTTPALAKPVLLPIYDLACPGHPLLQVHTVRSGETLASIASHYGTDVATLVKANNLPDSSSISEGWQLCVLNCQGVLHTANGGENLATIAMRYAIDVETLAWANRLEPRAVLKRGQVLIIPAREQEITLGPASINTRPGVTGLFRWPVHGTISSPFGYRAGVLHSGLDIAVPRGTDIRAAAPGQVIFAGWRGGYGHMVTLRHNDIYTTVYAHNSSLLVTKGEQVAAGQRIALSGSSGNSTGPHLHFEVRRNNTPVDPRPYLP